MDDGAERRAEQDRRLSIADGQEVAMKFVESTIVRGNQIDDFRNCTQYIVPCQMIAE
jgi:hypothetical protein